MTATFSPIISSLLDTDLYKFTMMQVILHRHPAAQASYVYTCRNRPEVPLSGLRAEIDAQLDHLCTLRFTPEELAYLRGLRFIKSDFVDFLTLFQLQRHFIQVQVAENGEDLRIEVQAPMLHGMLFEIYVLAIVNELYFRRYDAAACAATGRQRLAAKIELLRQPLPVRRNPLLLFDFGTRRRFSRAWHEEVVRTLAEALPEYFRGTSNVDLARRLGLTPIGTMAHEYLQAYQALGIRLRDFQRAALEDWVLEYRGDLGIALTDVVGMDAFLRDFDLYFCKLFDGMRHDSGDPLAWANQAIAHYQAHKIDANQKMLVFSDGLDVPRALALYEAVADRAKVGFGIGTNLSNDTGPQPLQVVMKMVACNGQPVAKLSDSPGKVMCRDETFLAYLSQVFQISPRS